MGRFIFFLTFDKWNVWLIDKNEFTVKTIMGCSPWVIVKFSSMSVSYQTTLQHLLKCCFLKIDCIFSKSSSIFMNDLWPHLRFTSLRHSTKYLWIWTLHLGCGVFLIDLQVFLVFLCFQCKGPWVQELSGPWVNIDVCLAHIWTALQHSTSWPTFHFY